MKNREIRIDNEVYNAIKAKDILRSPNENLRTILGLSSGKIIHTRHHRTSWFRRLKKALKTLRGDK